MYDCIAANSKFYQGKKNKANEEMVRKAKRFKAKLQVSYKIDRFNKISSGFVVWK